MSMSAPLVHAPVVRVLEREWVVWRRLWRGTAFSYVISPLLFLPFLTLIPVAIGFLVMSRYMPRRTRRGSQPSCR